MKNPKFTKKGLTLISLLLCTTALFYYVMVRADGEGQWPNTTAPEAVKLWQDAYESRGVKTSDGYYIIAMAKTNIGLQKLDSSGTKLWNSGSPVTITGSTASIFEVVADSSGGAFILHTGTAVGNRTKYVSRVTSGGTVSWTAGPFENANVTDLWPRIQHDGSNGVYVTWYTAGYNVHMTHLASNGTLYAGWNPGGTGTYKQKTWSASAVRPEPRLVLSDSNSIIMTFILNTGIRIYKITTTGTESWNQTISDSGPYYVMSETDGSNGVYIAYFKNNGTSTRDLKLAKVDSSGGFTLGSGTGGVVKKQLTFSTTTTDGMASASDSSGNLYLAWDQAVSSETDVYTQKFNSSGTEQWTSGGILLGTLSDGVDNFIEVLYLFNLPHTIVHDGSGGAIVAMNRMGGGVWSIVVGQRILSNGTLDWGTGYVLTGDPANDYDYMQDVISDGAGGAVFDWYQFDDTDSNYYIVAQAVKSEPVIPGNVPTTLNIANSTPTITAGPSDGGSDGTTPTNQDTDVTFTVTATDPNNDNYYLAICTTDAITAGTSGPPTCPGGEYAISTATASGSQASVTYLTGWSDPESNDWYAFVCDGNGTPGLCSASSQGTGSTGSPFKVNHSGTFGTVTVTDTSSGSIAPGDTIRFTLPNAQMDDPDIDPTQDTLNVFFCSGTADQGGVTTAFDYTANTCTGGTLLCSDLAVDPTIEDAVCDDTQDIVSVPTAHGSYDFKVYVEDQHNLPATGTNTQNYAVINVPPIFSSYTTTDSVNGTITAGGSDTLTRAVTFTDNNGDNDPVVLHTVFFEASTVTDACISDENDCYRIENVDLTALPSSGCSTTTRSAAGTGKTATGTDSSLTVSCDFTIWFNATASTDWEVSATAEDGGMGVNFPDSNVNSIIAALSGIGVTEASIAYGTVAVGGTSSFQGTNMENLGNQILDVLISGTDMTSGGNTIPNEQQKWDQTTADFDWDTSLSAFALVSSGELSTTPATGCANRDMAIRAAHATGTEDEDVYWKLRIPGAQASGSYTGTNTFATTASSTCSGTLY